MRFTVAIDGPSAAGKGTIARELAAHFGFAYLDTGLLYRAIALKVIDAGGEVSAVVASAFAAGLDEADLAADGLRRPAVTQMAAHIAAFGEVREVLRGFQRDFARRDGGAVLDGRDIGTVICPQAEAKLFITASVVVRAERRFLELRDMGEDVDMGDVLAAIEKRDYDDAHRAISPLAQAEDAFLLDTSALDRQAAFDAACGYVSGLVISD